MDVDISTVAGQPARSRTDAHADGSTFVPRKATISWFATNPTRTFFANALKADRNHRFIREISFYDLQEFHFAGQISLYDLEISFNDRSHTATTSGV